nr:MAG TPA: hypothetical protein [Caudoviricetes sp.]
MISLITQRWCCNSPIILRKTTRKIEKNVNLLLIKINKVCI